NLPGQHDKPLRLDLQNRRIGAGRGVLDRPSRHPLQRMRACCAVTGFAHPFTAPRTRSARTYRHTSVTRTSVGRIAITIAVLSRLQETSGLRARAAITTEAGRLDASPERTIAN